MKREPTPALRVSAPIAARVLGLSRRQFDRLVVERVLPRATPRLFDLEVVGPAFMQYLRDGREGSSAIAEARLGYVHAQRRALEQRTRERAGELVELADVKRVLGELMVTMRAQMEGLPGRCAAEVAALTDPAVVRHRLFEEVRRVLTAAAGELKTYGAGAGTVPAPAAAAVADSRPVG